MTCKRFNRFIYGIRSPTCKVGLRCLDWLSDDKFMQNPNFVIEKISLLCEPMTLDDVPQVSEIEKVSFSAPWSAETYRHELHHNRRSFYLVLRPEPGQANAGAPSLIGYGGYWLLDGEAHIMTIAIRPTWRRHHLGEWLLLELLDASRRGSAHQATLEVRVSNLAAITLYTKLGFTEVGLRKRYYRDNNEDARLLTLFKLDQAEVWQPLAQHLAQLRRQFSHVSEVVGR